MSKSRSSPVLQDRNPGAFGAMNAAENFTLCFHAVPNNLAAALGTFRREHVNRALEGIERLGFTFVAHFERLIVIISAAITLGHKSSSDYLSCENLSLRGREDVLLHFPNF
jgi:hypothetical protein